MVNLDGFNMVEISPNIWSFEVINGETYTGTLKQVILFAVKHYHFNILDIEEAINDMIENEHTVAHFGMWGTYVYGFTPTVSGRMAS